MLKLAQKIRERIIKRLENEGVAVITLGEKEPRVFGFREYVRRKQVSRKTIQMYKPWKRREKSLLGPIGTRPLGSGPDLSRTAIYENR